MPSTAPTYLLTVGLITARTLSGSNSGLLSVVLGVTLQLIPEAYVYRYCVHYMPVLRCPRSGLGGSPLVEESCHLRLDLLVSLTVPGNNFVRIYQSYVVATYPRRPINYVYGCTRVRPRVRPRLSKQEHVEQVGTTTNDFSKRRGICSLAHLLTRH